MPNRLNQGRRLARRVTANWFALGAIQAPLEKWAAVKPTCQTCPAVLHQRARILVVLGMVGEAKEVVRRLVRLAPAWRLALLDDPALDPVWM